MAKAWKDVIASPQYQALAPEQKAQAQEQYSHLKTMIQDHR
jgi:hypothetical protein